MRFRDPFDPQQTFIVMRPVQVSGVRLAIGDPIDKSTVSERTLRLLFQQRTLSYPHETGRDRARPLASVTVERRKAMQARRPQAPEPLTEIPEMWRLIPFFSLRQLANLFSAIPVVNKAEAMAVIEAELARRAVLAA